MKEEDFLKAFDEGNQIDQAKVLEIQKAYNTLNMSEIVGARTEQESLDKIIAILEKRVEGAKAKDFNDFFLLRQERSRFGDSETGA